MKRDITVTKPDNEKRKKTKSVAVKNNAPFTNCISEINSVQIDNAEDLDVVMPMYNVLEFSQNYRKTTGSLRNYYRDEPSNPLSSNSESFKYKASITGNTYNVNATVVGDDGNQIPNPNYMHTKLVKIKLKLKTLSNFWRTLNTPLINCEIELILTLSTNCALADIYSKRCRK